MNNLFLLLIIISFLCLPIFIIWALVNLARKRPVKKLFQRTGISALILIASFIGFGFTMEDAPLIEIESIELSIPNYQDEYDINTEIPIEVSIFPENADTSSLKYITGGNTLTFSDAGIITGTTEGIYGIYIASGDVTSNILSINVVDITAHEEAEALVIAKAEEEQRAKEQADKEAEKQKLTEEKTKEELEQQIIEEKAAQKAEEKSLIEEASLTEEKTTKDAKQQSLDEEQATDETEQQIPASEQPAQEVDSQSNTYSSGNGEAFNTYDNAAQQQTSATYVLNTNTHKFHYPSCSSVKKIAPQNYSTSNSSREELISENYSPCGNCKP